MIDDEIQDNLTNPNRTTRIGAISLIDLELMNCPSRVRVLAPMLKERVNVEDDELVLYHLHHIIAKWQPSYELGTFLFSGNDSDIGQRQELDEEKSTFRRQNEIVGLLSYSHRDNEHHGNFITHMGDMIKSAVAIHLGRDDVFDVLYDAKDIKAGEDWTKKIDSLLQRTTFLIPILSPSFIASKHCLYELETFMTRERSQRRDDLIIPIVFVEFDSSNSVNSDIIEKLLKRQHIDWTGLRFEQIGSKSVAQKIDSFAQQIVDAISRISR